MVVVVVVVVASEEARRVVCLRAGLRDCRGDRDSASEHEPDY
jgi:hypothetical protein